MKSDKEFIAECKKTIDSFKTPFKDVYICNEKIANELRKNNLLANKNCKEYFWGREVIINY